MELSLTYGPQLSIPLSILQSYASITPPFESFMASIHEAFHTNPMCD